MKWKQESTDIARSRTQLRWGPDYQPASHSAPCSVSLSVFLGIACSTFANVALRASASTLISVLSKVSLCLQRAVAALSSPPQPSASFVVRSRTFRFLFLTLEGREPTTCCRFLNIRVNCWSFDGDVQPQQLVSSKDRGDNFDPRHSVLICYLVCLCTALSSILRICLANTVAHSVMCF